MQHTLKLEAGYYYHIYNRGINSENLFIKPENYRYFLRQYEKYIEPIAETFAWCLMPNHFHLLVRIKEQPVPQPVPDLTGFQNLSGLKQNLSGLKNPPGLKSPEQQFSNLFNSYAKAFNKATNRHGGLFETPFRRKQIENENYFTNLIHYIHNNPVHHGFCTLMAEYLWSSYGSIVSEKGTKLQRNKVLEWFGNRENFISCHNNLVDMAEIEALVIE